MPSLSFGFSTAYFRNFIFSDPNWDYSTYDIAQNWRRDTRLSAMMLNADDPDLGPFKARHGKLLLWHGWADPALNPRATIRYVNEVRQRDPGVGGIRAAVPAAWRTALRRRQRSRSRGLDAARSSDWVEKGVAAVAC